MKRKKKPKRKTMKLGKHRAILTPRWSKEARDGRRD